MQQREGEGGRAGGDAGGADCQVESQNQIGSTLRLQLLDAISGLRRGVTATADDQAGVDELVATPATLVLQIENYLLVDLTVLWWSCSCWRPFPGCSAA